MSRHESENDGMDEVETLGLTEAIARLRQDLITAQETGAGQPVQLPVESVTVELSVVATKGADGKAGFKVPIIGAELGASATWSNAATQTVTITFGTPVDPDGRPVRVFRGDDGDTERD